jgi:hypothetical protein
MLLLMKESNLITPPSQGVRRLALERPEWLSVLDAAITVAANAEPYGGEFAGAWVLDELAKGGGQRWFPNLRILVSYGLIEKSGPSTRGGRRAYYRMPDRIEIEQALQAWRPHRGQEQPRTLRFIAAGRSSDQQADTARRAGEIAYEPRSWR